MSEQDVALEAAKRFMDTRLDALEAGLRAATAQLAAADGGRIAGITALRHVILFFASSAEYAPLLRPLDNLAFGLLDVADGHTVAMFVPPNKGGARHKTQRELAIMVWALVAAEAAASGGRRKTGKIGDGPDSSDGAYAFVAKTFAKAGEDVGAAALRKWRSKGIVKKRVSTRVEWLQKAGKWPTDSCSADRLVMDIAAIAKSLPG